MLGSFHPVRVVPLVLLALSLSHGAAAGQQKEDFTPERFAALQEHCALILVDVFAEWCPTCALQQKVLADYREKHPDVPLYHLTVDFYDQKE